MRGDLTHLRIIVAAAEAGSFSAAADRLGVEVSAVSRRIRYLEDRIGVSLFDRLARGVRLTDAGRSYVASVRDILDRMERADMDARLAAAGINGRLNIGFVWSFASGPIVDLMRQFQSANPSVSVRSFERCDDDLMVGLETSEFDIIMTAIVDPLHPRWKAIDRLLRQKLWLEQLVAVTPESFPVGYVTWEDLAGRIVLCRSGDDWRRFVNHVRELGGPTLDFSEQNVALDSLLGLVAAGTGWCILPASSARDDVANTKILPIISEGATLQVEAFWRPEVDNPALTRLLALARQMFKKTNQA